MNGEITLYYKDDEKGRIPYEERGIKKILTGKPLGSLDFHLNLNSELRLKLKFLKIMVF